MTVMFTPQWLRLASGNSATSQLTIYNGGSTTTFVVHFTDPHGLLAASQDIMVSIGQGQSATVPVSVTYPASLQNTLGPSVGAVVSVNGDPNRVGTATLTIWLNGAP
jgi:hypothetical protein